MDKFDETLAIVTGCSGGIGSEICKALANSNSKIQVVGLDVTSPKYEISNFKFYKCDITNITAQCGERFKEVNKILQLDSIFSDENLYAHYAYVVRMTQTLHF